MRRLMSRAVPLLLLLCLSITGCDQAAKAIAMQPKMEIMNMKYESNVLSTHVVAVKCRNIGAAGKIIFKYSDDGGAEHEYKPMYFDRNEERTERLEIPSGTVFSSSTKYTIEWSVAK